MSDDQTIREITIDEAGPLLASGAVLLDVREDDEWAAGHADEAVHIPMGEVADRLDELPADRTVVCICRMGGRSMSVANLLAGAGYDAVNLGGGMHGWAGSGRPVVTGDGAAGRVV